MLPVITPPTPGGGTPPGFSPPVYSRLSESCFRSSCTDFFRHFAFDLLDKMIGFSCGAWDPKTVNHSAREIDGTLKRNAMTLRDIDRLRALARAQNRPNRLSVVD